MTQIQGIITAMQTAMHPDGTINEAVIRRQIDHQIASGVDAVFCLGTNGEFYALNADEKIRVMEIYKDQAAGRVPVYAGTGCVTTDEAVYLSKKAQEIGVDVLSVITPYFAAITQDELYAHYAAVAEAVDLPIVLYNIPILTGAAISPALVRKLALAYPNIRGVKDSSGNFNNILQYIAQTKDLDFSVLSGNDALILWTLLAGGKGGITAVANILPSVLSGIYQNYLKGDIDAAKKCQLAIDPIRDLFRYGSNIPILKYAADYMGMPVGGCRKPFGMLTEEVKAEIRECVDTYYAEYKIHEE